MNKPLLVLIAGTLAVTALVFGLTKANKPQPYFAELPDYAQEPFVMFDSGTGTLNYKPELGTLTFEVYCGMPYKSTKDVGHIDVAIFYNSKGDIVYAESIEVLSLKPVKEVLRSYTHKDGKFVFENAVVSTE